jgi:hypothetical protein
MARLDQNPFRLVPIRVSRRLSRLLVQLGWLAEVDTLDKQASAKASLTGWKRSRGNTSSQNRRRSIYVARDTDV